MDYFTLLTVISDVQISVNIRILTYEVPGDKHAMAATLNMFLRPSKSPGLILRLVKNDLAMALPPSMERLIKTMEFRNRWLSVSRVVVQ